jgi:hypothetical protein
LEEMDASRLSEWKAALTTEMSKRDGASKKIRVVDYVTFRVVQTPLGVHCPQGSVVLFKSRLVGRWCVNMKGMGIIEIRALTAHGSVVGENDGCLHIVNRREVQPGKCVVYHIDATLPRQAN